MHVTSQQNKPPSHSLGLFIKCNNFNFAVSLKVIWIFFSRALRLRVASSLNFLLSPGAYPLSLSFYSKLVPFRFFGTLGEDVLHPHLGACVYKYFYLPLLCTRIAMAMTALEVADGRCVSNVRAGIYLQNADA